MQCSKCGKENPENAWLCLYCLRRVQASIRVLSPDEEIKRKKRKNVLLVVFGALVFGVLLGLVIALNDTDGTSRYVSGSSGTASSLSESAKRKLYYDMIATQDENPYSDTDQWNAWNQGVKDAAAKQYNLPMSEVNKIIHEGATEHWLQP